MTCASRLCLATILLPAAALLAAPVAAPAGEGAPSAAPAVFRGDARFGRQVTLAYRDTPLSEVLSAVGKQVGVKLAASGDTRDDLVTLFLNERPAAEALTLVARHLEFRWYRNETGYELAQDAASKRREAALRDGVISAAASAIQARMDLLGRLAGMPRDRLEARLQELNNQRGAPDLPPAQREALLAEAAAIRDLLQPSGPIVVNLYRMLNVAQLRQLYAGGEVQFSTANGTLPAPLAEQIHQAVSAQVSRAAEFRVAAPAGGADPAPLNPDQLPITGADAVIRLADNSRMMMFAPGAAGLPGRRAGARNRRTPRLEIVMSSHRGEAPRRMSWPIFWSPSVQEPGPAAATQTDDPVLKREVELALPQPPAPGADPTSGVRVVFGGAPPGYRPLSEVAEAVHKTTGLEVVADSYIRARLAPALVSGRRPVVQVLDAVAAELDYTWRKDGKLLSFRSNTWYEDRPAEVPRRILAPWAQAVARTRMVTLDSLAGLAAALTDPQARGMQDYWSWYLEGTAIDAPAGPGGIYDSRQDLRFWARLLPAQKQAALTGQAVPVEKMNALQRQAFLIAVTTSRREGFGSTSQALDGRTPTAQELGTGAFRMRQSQLQQLAFQSFGEDGEARTAVLRAIGPLPGAGQAPPPAPRLPDGSELRPAGAPTMLDNYSFAYHLAGNPAPARTANIHLPRPKP